MKLKEWVLHFVKNKAAFDVEDVIVEETDDEVMMKKSSGNKHFIIKDELDDSILDVIEKIKGDVIVVVTLNKKINVGWLVKKWNELIKFPQLSFMFVNTETSEKWALFPKTHDLITEKASLKKGLISLFEGVTKAD